MDTQTGFSELELECLTRVQYRAFPEPFKREAVERLMRHAGPNPVWLDLA